ncbi:MAG: hypothetical protein IJY93_04120 [Clostridia bacterium]|nr:hypothetical protein [Clostridia bacterium]
MEKSFQEKAQLLMDARGKVDSLIGTMMYHRMNKGMSREELSEKSGIIVSVIEKMEDIGICPDLCSFIMILRALELSLTLTELTTEVWDL